MKLHDEDGHNILVVFATGGCSIAAIFGIVYLLYYLPYGIGAYIFLGLLLILAAYGLGKLLLWLLEDTFTG